MDKKQYTLMIVSYLGILGIISYLFFNNFYMTVFMSPYIVVFIKRKKNTLIKKKKQLIETQFCDALEVIVAYLRSGISIEQAFKNVITDMELLHGKQSFIVKEFVIINNSVSLDVNIEDAIKDFAHRVDIETINNFAELMSISLRRDGNIISVMESICGYIKDKIELDRQVRISINSVLQEINIMKVMPFALLVYLRVCSNGYVDVMYKSIRGYVIMGTILLVYVITIHIINRMKQNILGI